MAVRDADPRRVAARDKADADAERRMVRQEARATAEAEAALLVARGYAAPEGREASRERLFFAEKDEEKEKAFLGGKGRGSAPRGSVAGVQVAGRTLARREAAFAPRPRLERTRVGEEGGLATNAGEAPDVESDAERRTSSEREASATRPEDEKEEEASASSEPPAAGAADAETALMELLLAEARDDAATEASNSTALTEADVDAVVDAVAAEASAAEESSETREHLVDARAAAASAAAALLGRRAGTAPGGARAATETASRFVSASFEWPSPALASERQAMKDAALERRVRAKLRSFLREAPLVSRERRETLGLASPLVASARPATAVGTRDTTTMCAEDALLASASSLDGSLDASYGSDDFGNSGDFEAFFDGGDAPRRAGENTRADA
jgi:hypothetical protein